MNRKRLKPDIAIDDRVNVPDGCILTIAESPMFEHLPSQLIESLRGKIEREWLIPHAYHCLPLVMGSQYGFIVKALYDFWVTWDGTVGPGGVAVRKSPNDERLHGFQVVSSHFGMGTVTIQNRWVFRTSPGVNLMTIAPPNYWIDGIAHLSGVVETDNLRRDFTFNLKITRPNHEIEIKQGTPIGCVLPYPRGYVDQFRHLSAQGLIPDEVINDERTTMNLFARERATVDVDNPSGNGRRYWNGEDIYGNAFPSHQTKLDPLPPEPKPPGTGKSER